MQIKSKYSWLKHLDFMVIDLISLLICFLLSYWMKFGDLSLSNNSSEVWIRYLFLVLALNVIITLFVNPYSGILRRPFYMEIIRAFQLAVYNLLLAALAFYTFRIGIAYSREMSFYMYGLYFFLSLLLKFGWKKLLVSGKIVVKTTRKIPLFIIGKEETIEENIFNVTAGDFQLYDVVGVHLLDGESGSGITEVKMEGMDSIPVIFLYAPGIKDARVVAVASRSILVSSVLLITKLFTASEDSVIVAPANFSPGLISYMRLSSGSDSTKLGTFLSQSSSSPAKGV